METPNVTSKMFTLTSILSFKVQKQIFPKIFKRHIVSIKKTKMTWEDEKYKYLKMGLDEKRQVYKSYVKLEDIPTWKQFADSKMLLTKIEKLPNCEIDKTKNSSLADKISYFSGDITHLEIDAIVNAANTTLKGGGGVDGAIHRAAGESLLEECISLNGCRVGEAKITGGYKLPSKYIIHTVGPKGEQTDLLTNCYKNSLKLMLDKQLKTIAFPCISTGIYGYPNLPAAHIAAYTVRKHLEANADAVDRVIFCLFMEQDKTIYEGVLQSYFPLI